MLFDAHLDLVKRLAREARVGKRDFEAKTVKLGPNAVTFVSAKSEDGVDFLRLLVKKVPVIKVGDYAKRSRIPELQANPVVVVEEEDPEDEDLDEDPEEEDPDPEEEEDDLDLEDEDLDEEDQDLEEDE